MPIQLQLRLQERHLHNWVGIEGKRWVVTCTPWRVLRGKGECIQADATFWSKGGEDPQTWHPNFGVLHGVEKPLAAWRNAKTDRKLESPWTPLEEEAQVLACQQSKERSVFLVSATSPHSPVPAEWTPRPCSLHTMPRCSQCTGSRATIFLGKDST